MRRFMFMSLSALSLISGLIADENLPITTNDEATPVIPVSEKQKPTLATFKQPFTGSITGSRVRLRLQPSLNSLVIQEFEPSDLVQVVGEIDDFYAILPDTSKKGYVFRTYVLDGIVEGSNVNLRFKPDMTSPIILQLQQGDKIQGQISSENPKWLEVSLPPSVHFYIAKEFVSKEGPLSLYKEKIQEKDTLLTQLNSIEEATQKELQKPFSEINLISLKKELESLIEKTKKSMPDLSQRASALLVKMQETYLQLSVQKKEIITTQVPSETSETAAISPSAIEPSLPQKEPTVSFFLKEQERALVLKKIENKETASQKDLYTKEKTYSIPMKGKIVPFERQLKIKPGDFILIDPITKVPMAYLYSTTVDLMPYAGMNVVIEGADRPNYSFALPAYFVHSISNQAE